MRAWLQVVSVSSALLLSPLPGMAAERADSSLTQALSVLKSQRFVDLTHAFAPGIPHWKGAPDERVTNLYNVAKNGFRMDEYCHVGQWGTHVDPPAHFHAGLRTVDQIDAAEMLMPLVVIDVHEKVAKNPDYVVTLKDIQQWEARHGAIPRGAFVALRTDWSHRWPDGEALANRDAAGVYHYPGWSKEVLELLYEKRGITASGHETTDTDPGLATSKDDYSLESYILARNHYQIELLANLDQVPEAGGIVWVTFPKVADGSGFPARVIAIVPEHGGEPPRVLNVPEAPTCTPHRIGRCTAELEPVTVDETQSSRVRR